LQLLDLGNFVVGHQITSSFIQSDFTWQPQLQLV
jgi:hypothetical protein